MAGGCAAEMLLQLEAHIHQDVNGHQRLTGVLDILGPQALSHQLVPLLAVHATVSSVGHQQPGDVAPKEGSVSSKGRQQAMNASSTSSLRAPDVLAQEAAQQRMRCELCLCWVHCHLAIVPGNAPNTGTSCNTFLGKPL